MTSSCSGSSWRTWPPAGATRSRLGGASRPRWPRCRPGGWGPDEAIILAACARFEVAAGNTTRARDLHAAAAARLRGVSHSSPIWHHLSTIVHSGGTMVALADGDVALARERAASAHTTAVQAADMPLIASVALVAAELALATGDQGRAGPLPARPAGG